MKRLCAQRRALVVKNYIEWEWHFRKDNTMWIRNADTGETINIGRIE